MCIVSHAPGTPSPRSKGIIKTKRAKTTPQKTGTGKCRTIRRQQTYRCRHQIVTKKSSSPFSWPFWPASESSLPFGWLIGIRRGLCANVVLNPRHRSVITIITGIITSIIIKWDRIRIAPRSDNFFFAYGDCGIPLGA